MLNLIQIHLFKKRKAWLLLTLSAFMLELIALYCQHIMLFRPCVFCIYQRCALFGIMFTGLFITISPTSYPTLRIFGLLFWIYSAWKGFIFAKKHNYIQSHSSPFNTCEFFVSFPSWLPLDKWIPSIFYAEGDCTEQTWYFLKLEISQWMTVIFFIYLIIPTILLIIISVDKYIIRNTNHLKNK